ncbi:hypothetical protein CVT24_003664 [Panaeolus cyanescens]|uniref:Uncharacterized protein n=1 Tax=Panaeolus cyanescens TaxID=181874 RepID=A0A409WC83_9AGAR|nr:hypothetical protein CVT24_003664 [Panaeolus cyanescens]
MMTSTPAIPLQQLRYVRLNHQNLDLSERQAVIDKAATQLSVTTDAQELEDIVFGRDPFKEQLFILGVCGKICNENAQNYRYDSEYQARALGHDNT